MGFVGASHIMFWKTAGTFTGLKLVGSLGRFGRTEISDIIGCLALPDGKVVIMQEWQCRSYIYKYNLLINYKLIYF